MAGPDEAPLWYVTLTLGGSPQPLHRVQESLERLVFERPFVVLARYAADRAEIQYWEEAATLGDAGVLALQVWAEHGVTAGLPPWSVVGLEVLDGDLYRQRWSARAALLPLP